MNEPAVLEVDVLEARDRLQAAIGLVEAWGDEDLALLSAARLASTAVGLLLREVAE